MGLIRVRPDSQSELLAGVASEIITPELGCQLAGFDARKGVAESVHDDLHTRALVLDDGQTTAALISVEILGLDRSLADRVRADIQHRTGIPATNVVIAATHTHCGPATFNHFFNQGQALDEAYVGRLESAIALAAQRAFKTRKPRRVRSGFVQADGIAVNRRTADGRPVDRQAGVLSIHEASGEVACLCVFFACHPTVLGPNTLAITADFPYFTGRRLQSEFGANCEILFFNGAEGDISVGHRSDLSAVGVIAPFRTFEKAEELGERLANAVIAGVNDVYDEETRLGVRRRVVNLPLKRYAPLAEMRARRERAASLLRAREEQGEPRTLLAARQEYLFSRIEEYYAALYETAGGEDPKQLPVEITAVRIGNTALLTFPGEVFVEIALEIRRRSPFDRTFFIGLANDYAGYLPTATADEAAGYEVTASRVSSDAQDALISGSIELLANII